MKDNLLRILPFYRWHPEVAIRYLPIVHEIKKTAFASILEVGSGGLGIAPYLGREITGIDSDFSGPKHPLLKMVQGTGENLPFGDKSFDIVISVDTLEHVLPKNRISVILEMVRVAKKEIIIAVPSGNRSQKQDKELSDKYKSKFGEEFHFLKEHSEYGLPEEKEILTILTKLIGPNEKTKILGNENLQLRKFLMSGWMTKNFFIDIFFRKILLFALPVLNFFEKEPYYRRIFFVTISK